MLTLIATSQCYAESAGLGILGILTLVIRVNRLFFESERVIHSFKRANHYPLCKEWQD